MGIKGNVRYLESISEFNISIDGNKIPSVSLNNGIYSTSYVLSALSGGNHTLTVTAKDNYGKIGSQSVSFTVESEASLYQLYSLTMVIL